MENPDAPRYRNRRKRSTRVMRYLIGATLTTAMVATNGMGALPENPISRQFQEVVSNNFPAEIIEPVNDYLEQASAPTIIPVPTLSPEQQNAQGGIDWIGAVGDAIASAIPARNQPPRSTDGIKTPKTTFTAKKTSTPSSGTITPAGSMTVTSTATLATASPTSLTKTATSTRFPSSTIGYIYPTITNTPKPPTATFTRTRTPTFTSSPTRTRTPTRTPTATSTRTSTPTSTSTSTSTATSTGTATSTNTPLPTATDTATPLDTATPTATVSPGGANLTNVSIDGLSSAAISYVDIGGAFTLNYDYSVWVQSDCPTCQVQLVNGLKSAGVGTSTCGYDGVPGVAPGTSGTALVPFTAPLTPGLYTVDAEYHMQLSCANAISIYPVGAQALLDIAQIYVWPSADVINVWSAGSYTGNLGGRSGADALCASTKPGAIVHANVRALISTSPSDSIANMPANYGVPTGRPLVYWGGKLIATNWPDFLDGAFNTALAQSGLVSYWWSGADDFGVGSSDTCQGFTSNSALDMGRVGDPTVINSGNIGSTSLACNYLLSLVCIAYP